jgi:hypothetical protein
MLIEELAADIAKHASTNTWWNCTTLIRYKRQDFQVGVKAFGLWAQRIEVDGLVTNVGECRTQKAFKESFRGEAVKLFDALIA